ncbi:LuxR C-terminal-related transcriptional regulator (plasmid) [Nocardia sp. NBC_01377]|uniref:helix-turn-helix transcriptional regulator n=1 Tax=Nocardia sp. NBC_01377 TaxID=2903595 RepID=UPI002F91A8C4
MRHEWPLIGRAEELAVIDAAMQRRDRSGGVVLAGAAGVGKTRLAREAGELQRRRGARVWWVTATECARAVPLGTFAQFVPETGDPRTLVRRVVDRIVGEPGRVVVAVDDAHLLDDLSALVVNHLVLQERATVVVTVRTGERVPDAIAAVWKEEHLERLEIQPLSRRETEVLVAAALGGHVEAATMRRLWQLSRGNALFLRQLVVPGSLRWDAGVWRSAEVVEVPPLLTDMVNSRILTLPQQVRAVIDVLALSEPLPVGLVDDAVEPGAVEQAEDCAVVTIESGQIPCNVRLAHPLFGEVRRAGMGVLRARRLRGEIATALADKGSWHIDAPERRAILLLESDLAADVALFVQVGERALALSDFRLAERLGRAATADGGGFPAQAIVAFAALWSGRPENTDTELAMLTELAVDDDQFVRATVTRATNLAYMLGYPDRARAILDQETARVSAPGPRDTLRALHAMIDTSSGAQEAGRDVATEILASPTADDAAILLASVAMVMWAATTGRDELADHMTRGTIASERVAEFANFRAPLTVTYVSGLVWAGYLDRAAAAAVQYRESVADSPYAQGGYLVGITRLACGDLETAQRELEQECRRLAPLGRSGGGAYRGALTALTPCMAILGNLDAAHVSQARTRRHPNPTTAFHEPFEHLADAWVAAAEGNVSAAIACAHCAAAIARRLGQHMHTVIALHTAARFGDRTVAAELAELATHVRGPRARAAAAHAAALAADDAAALNAAAAAFEDMGDRLCAADAASHAADSFTRHGRRGSANLAAARALRLAAACGGARSPALLLVANPLPLSQREREIITLAAQGLTNREIAARLTLSPRTVEGHLYRVSRKLGVAGRHEFAALLGLHSE